MHQFFRTMEKSCFPSRDWLCVGEGAGPGFRQDAARVAARGAMGDRTEEDGDGSKAHRFEKRGSVFDLAGVHALLAGYPVRGSERKGVAEEGRNFRKDEEFPAATLRY